MDENHQDKTESKLTATEDKSTSSSSSPQDQRGIDQLQNNQMEDIIKQLRDHGYKVTEEYSNTGLSKVSGEHPQRKTVWDWLQLLIVPLLIAGLGIGFTWVQNQTSLQIAKDTQEEATLKAYVDDMTTLLLDKKLGSQAVADKVASDEAAVIARAKTLIVLRRLTDPRRKARVVQFLYEAHLIGYPSCNTCPVAPAVIDLNSADLRGADLINADLRGADLSSANLIDAVDLSEAYLSFAHLSDANLNVANLSGANLVGADLNSAHLSEAYLNGADLNSAHLNGAHLNGANLNGADLSSADLNGAQGLTQQQLDQVYSCKNATLPQGLTCHRNI